MLEQENLEVSQTTATDQVAESPTPTTMPVSETTGESMEELLAGDTGHTNGSPGSRATVHMGDEEIKDLLRAAETGSDATATGPEPGNEATTEKRIFSEDAYNFRKERVQEVLGKRIAAQREFDRARSRNAPAEELVPLKAAWDAEKMASRLWLARNGWERLGAVFGDRTELVSREEYKAYEPVPTGELESAALASLAPAAKRIEDIERELSQLEDHLKKHAGVPELAQFVGQCDAVRETIAAKEVTEKAAFPKPETSLDLHKRVEGIVQEVRATHERLRREREEAKRGEREQETKERTENLEDLKNGIAALREKLAQLSASSEIAKAVEEELVKLEPKLAAHAWPYSNYIQTVEELQKMHRIVNKRLERLGLQTPQTGREEPPEPLRASIGPMLDEALGRDKDTGRRDKRSRPGHHDRSRDRDN